jgi:hypothetical protein
MRVDFVAETLVHNRVTAVAGAADLGRLETPMDPEPSRATPAIHCLAPLPRLEAHPVHDAHMQGSQHVAHSNQVSARYLTLV